MKRLSIRVGLVVLVGASLWASYREIVLKPFPFFGVEYVSSAEWDEEPKGFFKIPLSGKKSQDLEIVLKKISEFDSWTSSCNMLPLLREKPCMIQRGIFCEQNPKMC